MKEKHEKRTLPCLLCGKEKHLLIEVITASDTMFAQKDGVCFECVKKADINKEYFLKNKKVIEEHIKHTKESLEFWNEEIKRAESLLKEQEGGETKE